MSAAAAALIERPAWHAAAACRGDARWLDDSSPRAGSCFKSLRQVCRGCPVSGPCLAEALDLSPTVRHAGVLRCGVNGPKAWRFVEAIVADFAPRTPGDWSDLAAWLLDGDLAELDPPKVADEERSSSARPGAVKLPKLPGVFPTVWHYDPVAAGRGFTKAEIAAARV